MKNIFNLENIKRAAISLSQTTEVERNKFIEMLANEIEKQQDNILDANSKDAINAQQAKLSTAFVDRLILNEYGIKKIILRLKEVQKLESGIGTVLEERTLVNKALLKKIRVPLGTILVIYESRPEVTIDVTALCIKSGNAAILKGGSEAINTNKALYACITKILEQLNLAKESIAFIDTSDRKVINYLLKQYQYIDLVIARGGYDLVKKVINTSKIPVLAHAAGGARIYIDDSANLEMAKRIIINGKISKPSACNSIDTVLVHKGIADHFIPDLVKQLKVLDIQIFGDREACQLTDIKKASNEDWSKEFLDLIITIKIVNDINEAIAFINQYSKNHSEGIIASKQEVIDTFVKSIDAAAVFVNCSTRLHDGYVFGLGSEMGIATGKLHARGPVGLKELTTYKWEVYGNGQIRE